ncbi:MAG: 30S ribosomal protein S12 methylthiotransferase RimO [Candidatus Geothermincolia bacterium]
MRRIPVFLLTLGCPKNECDSDVIASRLDPARHKLVGEPAEADVIIINTCAFIEDARRESVDEILEMASFKGERCQRLIVTGCLVEKYGARLGSLLPEVDAFVPIADQHLICGMLTEEVRQLARGGGRSSCSTLARGMAYLKVAEGCDRSCAFCAIPGLRGPLRSTPIEDVLAEARWLLSSGARELVLVAQSTTDYGRDLYGESALPELLRQLTDVEGHFRVRVMYAQPDGVGSDLLDAMSSPKVCAYLDIPLQHASERLLRAMGRRGTAAGFLRQLNEVRAALPGVALRSTCIIGYPGETGEDHLKLMRFIEEARLDWLGLFGYSREEGTPAYNLGGRVRKDVRERRLLAASELAREIMEERAREQVGRTLEVLIEGPADTPGLLEGRSYREAPDIDGLVLVRGRARRGEMYPVRIEDTEGIDIVGRIARARSG